MFHLLCRVRSLLSGTQRSCGCLRLVYKNESIDSQTWMEEGLGGWAGGIHLVAELFARTHSFQLFPHATRLQFSGNIAGPSHTEWVTKQS